MHYGITLSLYVLCIIKAITWLSLFFFHLGPAFHSLASFWHGLTSGVDLGFIKGGGGLTQGNVISWVEVCKAYPPACFACWN